MCVYVNMQVDMGGKRVGEYAYGSVRMWGCVDMCVSTHVGVGAGVNMFACVYGSIEHYILFLAKGS